MLLLGEIAALLALDEPGADSHIQVFNDTEDVVLFERLLNRIEKHSHKLLHVLLLKALSCVPTKAVSQVCGASER